MMKSELYSLLNLSHYDELYPPPPYGNGENVIEFNGMHSWPCLRAALMNLSNEEFERAVNCGHSFVFHNNSNNGHTSVGSEWTIRKFILQNGGSKLQDRLKELK